MLKSLFSRRFAFHMIIAIILVVASVGSAYLYLLNYTRQDAVVEVPALEGYDLFEANIALKDLTLEGMIIDSLYLPEKRGGEVVDQDPKPGSKVKENRKIYLTIARYQAPMVKLPNILDQTLALAMAKLESYDIGIGELIHKPSDCTDCVIGVEYKGKTLEPGVALEKGIRIDLVIGEGATGERIDVPVLFGLNAEEARTLLNMQGLNIGATPYLDCEDAEDSTKARIFKQNPDPDAGIKIPKGSSVDIYLTSELDRVPPVNLDSTKALLR